MLRVAFVGWRGMVGSVLMQRMREENDFGGIEPVFFTTSNVGGAAPDVGVVSPPLVDARDLKALKRFDVIVTCQGGEYTTDVHDTLRKDGFKGYWIDAASTLRMRDDAVIILDPVNRGVIDQALRDGFKSFAGGNCTVSLMLMGLGALYRRGLVEWTTSMTYQSASGAGAKNMIELMTQNAAIADAVRPLLTDPAATALDIDRAVTERLRSDDFPTANFGAPLAASLLAWIDRPMENGQTREEWKAEAEANKILGNHKPVPMDGLCVRVGSMRCHSQALTLKLTKDVPLGEIEGMIREEHEWVKLVPNTRAATLAELTPAAVSGTLQIPVGRLRKMTLGSEYLTAFTVGDQLLWGAAEPLRRMLRILQEA